MPAQAVYVAKFTDFEEYINSEIVGIFSTLEGAQQACLKYRDEEYPLTWVKDSYPETVTYATLPEYLGEFRIVKVSVQP